MKHFNIRKVICETYTSQDETHTTSVYFLKITSPTCIHPKCDSVSHKHWSSLQCCRLLFLPQDYTSTPTTPMQQCVSRQRTRSHKGCHRKPEKTHIQQQRTLWSSRIVPWNRCGDAGVCVCVCTDVNSHIHGHRYTDTRGLDVGTEMMTKAPTLTPVQVCSISDSLVGYDASGYLALYHQCVQRPLPKQHVRRSRPSSATSGTWIYSSAPGCNCRGRTQRLGQRSLPNHRGTANTR